MKLDEFFATIGPFLEGRRSHGDTVEALYPGQAHGAPDAARLEIYARNFRTIGQEILGSVFPRTREQIVRCASKAAWNDLVRRYFFAHPPRRFQFIPSGAALPPFLAGSEAAEAAPWLVELADLELWVARTRAAPDEPEAGPDDRLRLASTVELRDYRHDLVAWLKSEVEGRLEGAPAVRPNVVMFWRDLELRVRRRRVRPVELLTLKVVRAGEPLEGAGRAGVSAGELVQAARELQRAGVLIGRIEGAEGRTEDHAHAPRS